MKKIIISLVAILIFKIGFSQNGSPLYPITQNLGSSSSLVDVKGGQRINGAFVLGHFVDTAAANAIPYVKNFANGLITTDTSLVWLRSYDAKKWLLMPTQGRVVNGDTIDYLVYVYRTPGQLNVYGKFFNGVNSYERLMYTDSIGSGGGSSYTFPYSVVAPGSAIQLENDTTANPANYFYGRNSVGRRGWYPQSGITGVNNGLVKNSSGDVGLDSAGVNPLTRNVLIDGGGNYFEIGNLGNAAIYSNSAVGLTSNNNAGTVSQISINNSDITIASTSPTNSSSIRLDSTLIILHTDSGDLRIPNLNQTTSLVGKKVVLVDTSDLDKTILIDPALIGGGGSSLTFTSPLNESGGVVNLGGLSGYGTSGQILSSTGTGLQYINQSSITGVNIYNSNGQATANRVFIGNGKTLNFNNFVGVTFDTSKVTIRTSTGFDAVGDSSFNVFNGGIHTSRGVRHDNLPYTLNITGKKISVIDTANGGTMYTIDPALIGGGSGITVGTTTITSGTNGRIGYNNSGVYGEKAVTGTGDVVLATSPTLVTPNIGVASGTSLTLSGLTTRRVLYNNDGLIKDTSVFTYSSSGELLVNTTTDLGNYNLQVGGQMASQRYDLYSSGGGLLGGLINNSGYMALNSSSLMALLGSSDIWINSGVDIAMSPRVAIGSSLGAFTATARLHIVGGTATANTAPLKFTSGTNLTTAEAGAMEYNGTNFFLTPSSAARNNILMTASVNSVSPTSPDRTITVVIDGTTYYIHAKTTND